MHARFDTARSGTTVNTATVCETTGQLNELPGQELAIDAGSCWLIRRPLNELWPQAPHYLGRAVELSAQFAAISTYDDSIRIDIGAFCAAFPQRVAILDVETCGLAGSSVFLIGLLHNHEGEICLSQYWARNYAEERPLLAAVRGLLANQQVLVTFNGKSFDWPQIRDRTILHERDPGAADNPLVHFDLLHHARRRWRHELPNCKLQTLERYVCGRHRTGDIPGRDIPQAYHDYVRTGDTLDVQAILHHNALDLVTLLQLALLFIPVT
jgi:uncharacterized protein YprB with RNaseH-like and TPR domain